jgi:hypothetical protein
MASHTRGPAAIDSRRASEAAFPGQRKQGPTIPESARLVDSGDRFQTAYESQATHDDPLRRVREQHDAAPTTVEALMWGFRIRGIAHLQEPNCRRRLTDLSTAQLCEVIKRLLYCRKTYPGRDPGITDELLLKLDELR